MKSIKQQPANRVNAQIAKEQFDSAQRAIFEMHAQQHALVIGAPGSGKTTAVLAAAAQHQEVLILGSNREVAAALRKQYLQVLGGTVSGAVAQTTQAFAFALLVAVAQQNGTAAPRLLTAVLQDEIIAEVLAGTDFMLDTLSAQQKEADSHEKSILRQSVVDTVALRTELRNLWQLLDELNLTPEQAHRTVVTSGNYRWQQALEVLAEVWAKISRRAEYSASGVLLEAIKLLQQGYKFELPRLIVVDDASELSLLEQRLLGELAERGVAIWLIADPDLEATVQLAEPEHLKIFAANLKATPHMLKHDLAVRQIVMPYVHRHGHVLREFVQQLSTASGVRGEFKQREAVATGTGGEITAMCASSESGLSSAISYQLRRHYLGVNTAKTAWEEMVVVCRSRATVTRLRRELQHRGVPTKTLGGGIVLREHTIVRDLVTLLKAAFNCQVWLSEQQIKDILVGPLGQLDITAVANLKKELLFLERQQATDNEFRQTSGHSTNLLEAAAPQTTDKEYCVPQGTPLSRDLQTQTTHTGLLQAALYGLLRIDDQTQHSAALGRLLKFREVLLAAQKNTQLSLHEQLWVLWNGLIDAEKLQQQALSDDIDRAALANQQLDAALELFYVVSRNESQAQGTAALEFLREIMENDLPQDTLAQHANKPAVTVTTPHALIGKEYRVVCVADLQEGAWPNMCPRDGVLQLGRLRLQLTGQQPTDTRRQLAQAETRLFLLAASRAKEALYAFTVSDGTNYPSNLWRFLDPYIQPATEIITPLTLRDEVAQLRSQLEKNPHYETVAAQLATLASCGVAGAAPAQWYGALAPSGQAGLFGVSDMVSLSASNLVDFESCQLHAALNVLHGDSVKPVKTALGTFLHKGLEESSAKVKSTTADIMQPVLDNLQQLRFANSVEREITLQLAETLAYNINQYVTECVKDGWQVIASELQFMTEISSVKLRGVIDRVEAKIIDEQVLLRVIDLKTGKTQLSAEKAQTSPQLAAYQYAVTKGALKHLVEKPENCAEAGQGSKSELKIEQVALLYPRHEQASGRQKSYKLVSQDIFDESELRNFAEQVQTVAAVFQSTEFIAQVESHCNTNIGSATACEIHLIPAVSWEETDV